MIRINIHLMFQKRRNNISLIFQKRGSNINPMYLRKNNNINHMFHRKGKNINHIFHKKSRNINHISHRKDRNINHIFQKRNKNMNLTSQIKKKNINHMYLKKENNINLMFQKIEKHIISMFLKVLFENKDNLSLQEATLINILILRRKTKILMILSISHFLREIPTIVIRILIRIHLLFLKEVLITKLISIAMTVIPIMLDTMIKSQLLTKKDKSLDLIYISKANNLERNHILIREKKLLEQAGVINLKLRKLSHQLMIHIKIM